MKTKHYSRIAVICKQYTQKDGMKRLWVEHGTINHTVQHFWGKYFSRLTYTLTRKIDERILKK